MQGVVDADTHIAEPEAMWKLIDEKMAPRRPVLVNLPDDTWFGDRNALWLIDGNIFPKPAGKGSYRLVTPSAQKAEKVRGDIAIASREVADVGARISDMDRLGVDVQVIYPTLFLVYITDDPELDTALSKAYNSWQYRFYEASFGNSLARDHRSQFGPGVGACASRSGSIAERASERWRCCS